jgi:hypothetical protein
MLRTWNSWYQDDLNDSNFLSYHQYHEDKSMDWNFRHIVELSRLVTSALAYTLYARVFADHYVDIFDPCFNGNIDLVKGFIQWSCKSSQRLFELALGRIPGRLSVSTEQAPSLGAREEEKEGILI